MKRRTTTQDISWFLDLSDNNQLNLNPSYQRRSVWTRKDRIYFLDTIFNGYPCPAIFLHKTTDDTGKSTYHVVDGKQRIETIIMFANGRLSIPKDHADTELSGKKFDTLNQDYKERFWNYVLVVDMLDIVEQAVVDEIFDRLNRNSRKLEKQELRHAKYDGWMIAFCEKQSEEAAWKELGVSTTSRAKRMKDVQFISELVACTFDLEQKGFSQDDLDEIYALYDTPEEDVPGFDKELFENLFIKTRDYLLQMNNHNQCITNYAKSYMHFYTIWNFVLRNKEGFAADVLADKYRDFMEKVSNIDRSEITNLEEIESSTSYMKYAANAVGANTEKPQRDGRLEAMESVILQ